MWYLDNYLFLPRTAWRRPSSEVITMQTLPFPLPPFRTRSHWAEFPLAMSSTSAYAVTLSLVRNMRAYVRTILVDQHGTVHFPTRRSAQAKIGIRKFDNPNLRISGRIQSNVHVPQGTFPPRFGGAEFTVSLPFRLVRSKPASIPKWRPLPCN